MMKTRIVYCKVAGVTFEGRQDVIAQLRAGDWYRLKPEPENPYDANALAVWVALPEEVRQIGSLPRDYAQRLAPLLGGEELTGQIAEISGGFVKWDGSVASYGVVLKLEVPEDESAG